jgi:hypothetical protein
MNEGKEYGWNDVTVSICGHPIKTNPVEYDVNIPSSSLDKNWLNYITYHKRNGMEHKIYIRKRSYIGRVKQLPKVVKNLWHFTQNVPFKDRILFILRTIKIIFS